MSDETSLHNSQLKKILGSSEFMHESGDPYLFWASRSHQETYWSGLAVTRDAFFVFGWRRSSWLAWGCHILDVYSLEHPFTTLVWLFIKLSNCWKQDVTTDVFVIGIQMRIYISQNIRYHERSEALTTREDLSVEKDDDDRVEGVV